MEIDDLVTSGYNINSIQQGTELVVGIRLEHGGAPQSVPGRQRLKLEAFAQAEYPDFMSPLDFTSKSNPCCTIEVT